MIKTKLKKLGITLLEFARELEITRPTLDTYIEIYEKGNEIPKDKYQKIFETLFENEFTDKKEFLEVLHHCHAMIKRDKALGTFDLDAAKTDIMTSVNDEMKNDMLSKDFDETIYIFINMLIRSYKSEPILKNFVKYVLILNSRLKIDNINDEDKVYLSNYYRLFSKEKNNELEYDEEYYNKFLGRINELKREQDKSRKELEVIIHKKINDKIKELIALGLDVKDIDIDKLINSINFDTTDIN